MMNLHCKHFLRPVAVLFFLACFNQFFLIPTNAVEVPESMSKDSEYIWKKLVNVPTSTFEQAFLPNYIDFHREVLQSETVSADCSNDLFRALEALRNRQTWAVQLFNAWGKFPPSGIARGTLTDFGDYDQCLSVDQADQSSSLPVIVPQYCLIDVALPMPPMPKYHNYHQKAVVLPEQYSSNSLSSFLLNSTIYRHLESKASVFYYVYVKLGICLPKSCTKNDIASITKKKVNQVGLNVRKFQCETMPKNRWNLNNIQIGAIAFLLSFIILTFIAAIYDRVNCNKSEFRFKFLLWFSPSRNVRKLINTKSIEDELSCVHGLRFITIIWIMLAHTMEWTNLNIYRDTFMIKDRLSQVNLQLLFKAFYSVETFFYLSGLLTSYVVLKFTRGEYKNFKYFDYIVLRWCRLTPQLIIFLLITSLLPPLFDGPIWQTYMQPIQNNCYKNWWLNALYLQNFIDIGNICAVHTWYLATDMQLHWLSLIPIVFLLIHRRNGLIFTSIYMAISVLLSGGLIYVNQFPPGHIITSKNDFLDEFGMPSDFVAFLYKPWNHASVFFIGFIFGVYIPNAKSRRHLKLPTHTKYFLWLCVFAGYLFCIWSTVPYVQGKAYDSWSAIIFPMNRILWALTLSLLVWLCVTNNGGIAGRVLSWSGFKPFSRMTYAIYLTHAWILYIVLGARRELIDLSTRSMTLHLAGVVICAFIVGFLFNVIFETPIIHALDCYKTWRTRGSKGMIKVDQGGASYDVNGNDKMTQRKDVKLLEIRSNLA